MRFLKDRLRAIAAFVLRFARDRRGVSTVEYALIVVAVIAIVSSVAVTMGDAFDALFQDLATEMQEGLDTVSEVGGGGGGAPTPPEPPPPPPK